MEFEDKISSLAKRIPGLAGHIETEEATKNALIMPFIAALGYDVFNPKEVLPEFVADVGTKKGEKVDYAILHDGVPAILIECKQASCYLTKTHMSQLFRYFGVTEARVGILTNGIEYRFFSDLDQPNVMDTRPFLELDLSDPQPGALAKVKKLGKSDFDLERMLSVANELMYTSEIKKVLTRQVEDPDEEIVRFFFSQVNSGARFTAAAKEQFTELVRSALRQFVSERVSDRLDGCHPDGCHPSHCCIVERGEVDNSVIACRAPIQRCESSESSDLAPKCTHRHRNGPLPPFIIDHREYSGWLPSSKAATL